MKFAAAFFLALAAHAQTATGAFFALSVPDVKASARWYVDKLGMKIDRELPNVIILENANVIVELIERKGAADTAQDPFQRHGIAKAGFIVDDFDKTLKQLRARGVEFAMGPYPARPDQRENVIIRDNNGNYLQIFGRTATR
jgi:catechol 2,3-dioxygenase-like lactoylglutathione lyase family enzyme